MLSSESTNILATVRKTAGKQGYIVRALQENKPQKRTSSNEWHPAAILEPGPSSRFLRRETARYGELGVASQDDDGFTTPLEARGDSVPVQCLMRVKGSVHLPGTDYAALKGLYILPGCCGESMDGVRVMTSPNRPERWKHHMIIESMRVVCLFIRVTKSN